MVNCKLVYFAKIRTTKLEHTKQKIKILTLWIFFKVTDLLTNLGIYILKKMLGL